jgi:uncharacterized sporulation protein YeaH/YhbH (DUF444 family)
MALRRPGAPLAVTPDALRFRRDATGVGEEAGAVLLAMMDTSGSMGPFERQMARSFFFWALRFLRRHHPRVEVVFLAHDVRAREVPEDLFFHRGASGGTVSSSVYRLAHDLLDTRYPAARYNAYAFHFTDGGNLTSDNAAALASGTSLAEATNLFGYGEIHDTLRNPSPLYQAFQTHPRARVALLRHGEDLFGALAGFFSHPGEAVP